MSLLEVDERVFSDERAGPLKLGLPVGTWRPDDEGADLTDGPETRMHYRRIVMLTFQTKTGNKQWALLELNVFGNEVRKSEVPIAPPVSAHKALFEAVNIDFFEEFQNFNYALHQGGKLLWVKKSRVYTMMSKFWKVGWAYNWPTVQVMREEPSRAAARDQRNKRMLEDSYDVPYFDDEQMGKEPGLHRKYLYLRMEGAEFRDMSEISVLSNQFEREAEVEEVVDKVSAVNTTGTKGISAELLQERFLLFQALCDRVTAIRDQIIAEFGFDQFALKEVRIQHHNGELPATPKVSKKLLEKPEQQQSLGEFILPSLAEEPSKDGLREASFAADKEIQKQAVIDKREGQTIAMSEREKSRWDEIEAERARQREIVNARSKTPTKDESRNAEVSLKISTIENPILPPTQLWLAEEQRISIFESGWLIRQGVTKAFAMARLDSNLTGQPVRPEDHQKIIRAHNECHDILEDYHRGMELALGMGD